MRRYETNAGIELTDEQCKLVASFERLMNKWDENLCVNSIAGNLNIMLLGGTNQNPIPEMSDTGGFNQDNLIDHKSFSNVKADGGDW